MKNVFKKMMIPLLFALVLLLSILPGMTYAKENNTNLNDNQEIRIPIAKPEANETSKQKGTTKATAANNVGYVDVWISNNPKRINWKVVVNPPYKGNGFKGILNITNLSSGLNYGREPITKMSGKLVPPLYLGKYGARLEGVLTYNGVTTGVTVFSPYLVFEIK